MNWKECGKKCSWCNLRYYPDICLAGLSKITKKLNQQSQCPSWDPNWTPPEYEQKLYRSDTLYTTNLTWTTLGLNQCLHGNKPVTNHLSYCTAQDATLANLLNQDPDSNSMNLYKITLPSSVFLLGESCHVTSGNQCLIPGHSLQNGKPQPAVNLHINKMKYN